MAFQCDYELLTEEEKYQERRVAFFCDENDDQLLMNLIEHHLPWLQIKNFMFASIEQRFSTLIQNFVRDNHLGQCKIYSFHQMELDRITFENKRQNITSSHLEGIDIRPLSISDASIVDDHWTYKSETSLSEIQYEIEHLPAYGKSLLWICVKFSLS